MSYVAGSLRIARRHAAIPALAQARLRHITGSAARLYARKDSQDRESINTQATEYSKSGTDDNAAHLDKAAFEPGRNDPKEEMDTAEEESNGNPLDASPANTDISQPRDPREGGAESSASESGETNRPASGGGSPQKAQKLR